MKLDAIVPGNVAVVTGGGSGIGLAAASEFARLGMNVAIVDRDEWALESARVAVSEAAEGRGLVVALCCDVSNLDAMRGLHEEVTKRLGMVHVLMNNAGIQPGSSIFLEPDNWADVIGVNLWGVIHGTRVFGPKMIAGGEPGLIINTGSKQGITTPPGDPAYNVSKAGVKVFTEALEHDLRSREGCRVRARLLIPGFVFTPLTAGGRTQRPAGAWTSQQTIAFMLERLAADDFYILCPDNEVDRATDENRIRWAADDIVKNRPPLSRWHPDHADAFNAQGEGA